LIETLRWTPDDGFIRLALHLDRLCHSAAVLGFSGSRQQFLGALQAAAKDFPATPQRVRLLLEPPGRITIDNQPLELAERTGPIRYAFSSKTVNSHDPLLRHKTTRRALFDNEHIRLHAATGCDEVLFINEKGELTEGSRTSLFVRSGGQLLTPPLSCGLLDGVLRRHLLQTRANVRESVLYSHELANADEVLLGNSLRGLQTAHPL